MTEIATTSKTAVLRELANDDPAKVRQILEAITRAVADTFVEDRGRSKIVLLSAASPTEAEMKRRTELAYSLFIQLRGDCHLSTRRSLDFLPTALRAELDGTSWEPPEAGTSWGGGS